MAVWSAKRDRQVGELGVDCGWNRILGQASSLFSASPRMGVVVSLRLGLKTGSIMIGSQWLRHFAFSRIDLLEAI